MKFLLGLVKGVYNVTMYHPDHILMADCYLGMKERIEGMEIKNRMKDVLIAPKFIFIQYDRYKR